MNQKRSEWYPPGEVLGLLVTIFLVPTMGVLVAWLLPAIQFLRLVDVSRLFLGGLGTGLCGIALLFFARLPLYRQRRFWTFGPRELDRRHRQLYWLAYAFVVASIALLAAVWCKTR